MDIKEIVKNLYNKIKNIDDKGKLASYIPELENVKSEFFGVHISTIENLNFGVGNYDDKFSVQSIVKVLSLTMAYSLLGEKLWKRGLQ